MIDGDGSVAKYYSEGRTLKRIALYGNKYITNGFALFVKKNIKTKAEIIKGKTCYIFSVQSKKSLIIIALLYDNAKIYLLRKKKIASILTNISL